MLCPNCGKELPAEVRFCYECGHKLGSPAEQVYINYSQPKPTHKVITSEIKVWCIICITVQSLATLFNFIFAASQSFTATNFILYSGVGRGTYAVLGLLDIGRISGYFLILKAKKSGFYAVCFFSAVITVLNSAALGFSVNTVISGVTNPLVTWLFIKKSWDYFK